MGKLDKKTVSNDASDDFDDMDVMEFDDLEFQDELLSDIHPDIIAKSTRRRLEDMLEDRRLQKQLGDYNFEL